MCKCSVLCGFKSKCKHDFEIYMNTFFCKIEKSITSKSKRNVQKATTISPKQSRPKLKFSFQALPFTDRLRNMGEGKVFTPVCHSVHRGMGVV